MKCRLVTAKQFHGKPVFFQPLMGIFAELRMEILILEIQYLQQL
jgi:hypothetical protein